MRFPPSKATDPRDFDAVLRPLENQIVAAWGVAEPVTAAQAQAWAETIARDAGIPVTPLRVDELKAGADGVPELIVTRLTY